jgi:hypothetical protein
MINGVCSMCGFADPSYTSPDEIHVETDFAESAMAQDDSEPKSSTALINCPACSNRVSETAANCPKCGFVLTSEFVAAEKQKLAQSEQITNSPLVAFAAFGFMLLAGLYWSWVSSGAATSRDSAAHRYSAAQKVTYIDRGDFNSGATVQMQASLDRLSRRYDLGKELIASKLLVAQELLERKNVHETVQQLADSVEAANQTTLSVSFDELLASIVTLCGERTDVSDNWPAYDKSDLAEQTKRRIFYELVAAQDAGVGDERAFIVIAERHKISVAEVEQIATEGAMRDWPMP